MENSVFPARTAVFDPCLSVYKSGDECLDFLVDWKSKSLWIFTGEGKFFSFSWKSILFVFLGGCPVPDFTQRAGILAIIAC